MNLKEIRKENNMTQKQLADMLGYEQTIISMWENNSREPSNNTLIKLSKIFNCSIDYLLDNEVKEKKSNSFELDLKEYFTEKQIELINYIKNLNDYQCKLAKIYFKTLLNDFKIDNKNLFEKIRRN